MRSLKQLRRKHRRGEKQEEGGEGGRGGYTFVAMMSSLNCEYQLAGLKGSNPLLRAYASKKPLRTAVSRNAAVIEKEKEKEKRTEIRIKLLMKKERRKDNTFHVKLRPIDADFRE